jgi:hypothetical protein
MMMMMTTTTTKMILIQQTEYAKYTSTDVTYVKLTQLNKETVLSYRGAYQLQISVL